MARSILSRARLGLYIRMILGTALLGIGFGYYLQAIGRLQMSGYLIFEFAMRGMIVGALVWAFEIFFVTGPNGSRLAGLTTSARFAARIVAYLVLGELGYWIGEAIFEPEDIADLFHTAGGKD